MLALRMEEENHKPKNVGSFKKAREEGPPLVPIERNATQSDKLILFQ